MNQSFQSGIFPNKLKIAKVISIFNKGNPELSPSHYRPISLLSVFCKIIEKLMRSRLDRFFEIHNVLYSSQIGFQENRSMNYALVSLTEAVRNAFDNKEFRCDVFINLKKAFDTVNNRIFYKN